MYIDENIAHAEFGSDGDTKNRSATGSLFKTLSEAFRRRYR